MMSDSNGDGNKSKRERRSSSRLSHLAQPFNFNTSASTLDHQPSLNSLDQCYDYGCYLPYDDPQSQSRPYLLYSDSIAVSSSLADALTGDHDVDTASSLSYHTFPTQVECTISQSLEYNSTQARVMRPAGANKSPLLLKPGLSEIMDSCYDDVVINNENYSGRLSGTADSCCDVVIRMEPQPLPNAKDKMGCHEKVPIGKEKEKKNGESVINEAIDPLDMAETELLITSPGVFSSDSHGTESGIHVQNSSAMLDQNDSDVDSPCWKGTGAYQSTFGVTKPVTLRPKIEIEAHKTLNPLAPHFFPESAKQLLEYHENECHGNDSLSFLKTVSSIVALSSKEHTLTDSVKTETCSLNVSNIIGTQSSNDIHDGRKEYSQPKKLNSCFVPNFSLANRPFLVEDYLTSDGQGVTRANVACSVKDIKDTIHNDSSSVTSAVTRNFWTSSCSRRGVPSVDEKKLGGASDVAPPKLDVQLVINIMHDLSKLLMWKYSNDLVSLNEHQHDMIQHTINNLYICMKNEVGQRVSTPKSGHKCTSYSLMKLSDSHKEFQVTRMKALTVPHDQERQKSWSTMFNKKEQGLSSSLRYDEGIKKGDKYVEMRDADIQEGFERKSSNSGRNASSTFVVQESPS